MNSIIFVTKSNNNFYKLEPAKTLLHFMEYDFTYFWEQAIELGQAAKNAGGFQPKQGNSVKGLLIKCHPYFEAQANADFDNIVLDCIIEYICQSEGISLEELWNRCIAPKSMYERAIFTRISEYKTGRGINQWANLVRMQDYAKQKLAYCFDGPAASRDTYTARKAYFDLTFSVLSKELGYPSDELPYTRRYSAALMPNAAFALTRISKGVLKQLGEIINEAGDRSCLHIPTILRDEVGMEVFALMRHLPRPEEPTMKASEEFFRGVAEEIYMPESFKAAIDLELDKMIEEGLFLQKCEKCSKYFLQDLQYIGRYCNRVNASGLTCREQERDHESTLPVVPMIPKELEERCEKVTETLIQRINDGLAEREVKEWVQYLENMKENVRNEFSTAADLESFLDYSEKMAADSKLAAKLKNPPPVYPSPSRSHHQGGSLGSPEADSSYPPKVNYPEAFGQQKNVPKKKPEPTPYQFPVLDLNELAEEDVIFFGNSTRVTPPARRRSMSEYVAPSQFQEEPPEFFLPFSPENLEHIERPKPQPQPQKSPEARVFEAIASEAAAFDEPEFEDFGDDGFEEEEFQRIKAPSRPENKSKGQPILTKEQVVTLEQFLKHARITPERPEDNFTRESLLAGEFYPSDSDSITEPYRDTKDIHKAFREQEDFNI